MKTLPLDFVTAFCHEMHKSNGEDSFCYSFCDSAGIIAAFDGCGGAGARRHDIYSNHTEAYMASRLCAGAVFDSFCKEFPSDISTDKFINEVCAKSISSCMKRFSPPADNGVQIKGSMVRTLPTTLSAAIIRTEKKGITLTPFWAGDSRVYVIDSNGLAQLSQDDTTVKDPMKNIYEDGVMRNLVSADKNISLSSLSINMTNPFIAITATDGCFGYISTPMEFEFVLLNTLIDSGCVEEWKDKLSSYIGSVAGDDNTMCIAAFGFGDFNVMKNSLVSRYNYLNENYIYTLQQLPLDDRQSRYELWDSYKSNYFRFVEGGND